MPSWIETIREIENRNHDADVVRRERIRIVENITGRPLIVYATDFLNPEKLQACNGEVSIDGNDKTGINEVIQDIQGDCLDILIQSPGGTAEAAESIVELLHSKFKSIRFIVPDQAKSAATMMCCSGEEVLMDYRSELGPIDPQMSVPRADGSRITVPAQALTEQFEKASDSIKGHPENLPAWLPILQSYAPCLLVICSDADKLSKDLVKKWLSKYMFHSAPNIDEKVTLIAEFLANSKVHLSHGRRIGADDLASIGMNIHNYSSEKVLQDAIWNLFIAIKCTFENSSAFKIIENGHGAAYIRSVVVKQIQLPNPGQSQIGNPDTSKKKHRH